MVISGFRMKEIDANTEVCKFNGVNMTTAYVGGLTCLTPAKLKWRKEENEYLGDIELLTLREIAEQIGKQWLITVIVDDPFCSEIYQYGNYSNDKWYLIGTTCGYA